MIELSLKDGTKLEYDDVNDVVKVNGKVDKNWHGSFIENGKDDPTFFGFTDTKTKKCYDIYGGISNISTEDSIKL